MKNIINDLLIIKEAIENKDNKDALQMINELIEDIKISELMS